MKDVILPGRVIEKNVLRTALRMGKSYLKDAGKG